MYRHHDSLRVLVLAPFPPRLDATYGGGRAIGQLVRSLAAHHRVALLCLRSPHDRPTDPLLTEACELVEEIAYAGSAEAGRHPWRRRGRLVLGWLGGRPMWASDAYSPVLARRARVLVRDWRPDVVQVEFHVMAQYLSSSNACSAARVLTDHDPGVHAHQFADAPPGLQARMLQVLENQAWRRFTRHALRTVHATVVFSERDRRALEAIAPRAPVVRIPLAVGSPRRLLNPHGGDPPTVLFVGSYTHAPNVDAALRLIRDIFPRVSANFPDARLCLVGDEPTQAMRAAASSAVKVMGRVRDVEPYLDQAAVVVAPLRIGGGTRVKVLEALAAGKAVVASKVALAGLDVRHGEHVLVADTDEECAATILRLLHDPPQRIRLARQAYAWARTNLDPERSLQAYEALYRSLLETRVSAWPGRSPGAR